MVDVTYDFVKRRYDALVARLPSDFSGASALGRAALLRRGPPRGRGGVLQGSRRQAPRRTAHAREDAGAHPALQRAAQGAGGEPRPRSCKSTERRLTKTGGGAELLPRSPAWRAAPSARRCNEKCAKSAPLCWMGSGARSSAPRRTSRIRTPSTSSRSSPSWRGSGSAPTGSRPAPTARRRRSRRSGSTAGLAVLLALATSLTVFIISYAYSRVIEHFPSGGGGYVVATKLLGKNWGVLSGCALLVDYVLTITVSIASGADAVFSLLPPDLGPATSCRVEFAALVVLTIMNIRGVKESVTALLPIFMVFVVTHAILLVGILGRHVAELPAVSHEVSTSIRSTLVSLGTLRHAQALRPRVLARRRHVHRHRGRLERRRHHARAAGADGQAHHGADGALARDHRRRHPPLLPAPRRPPRPEQDHERGPVRVASPAAGSWAASTSATPSSGSRCSARARSSSSPRRPASSTARGSWPTWPSTRGSRTASPRSRSASRMRNGVLLMGGASIARAPLHGRRRREARGHVLDQRLRHVLALQPRHVPVLDPAPRRAPGPSGSATCPSTSSASRSASPSSPSPWSRSSARAAGSRWSSPACSSASAAHQAPLQRRRARHPRPRPGVPRARGGRGLRRGRDRPPARALPIHAHREGARPRPSPRATSRWRSSSSAATAASAATRSSRCSACSPRHFHGVVFVSVAVVDSDVFKGADEVEAPRGAARRRTSPATSASGRSLGLADGERLLGRHGGRRRGREARDRALRASTRGPGRRRPAHLRGGHALEPRAPQRDGVHHPAAAPARRACRWWCCPCGSI